MRKILLTISLVCLMGAPSAFAYYPEDGDELAAQEVRGDQGDYEQRRDRRGEGMRGNPHKKMKKIRSKILRKRVGLDEATLARVEAIFESFDEERKELHQAKRKTMKALRDLVQSDSDEQEAYATLILAMKQAREGLRQLREEEAAQLADVLTPKQQVKLMMALHKMKRRMQGMRGKRGRRGGGEGRRGPRHRRGVDEEGGGYGPPPGRSGRGYGGERIENDRIDL